MGRNDSGRNDPVPSSVEILEYFSTFDHKHQTKRLPIPLLSLPYSERNIFTKFRISVHNLEIEKGRHKNLPEHKRICTLCNCEVEDEIHFLMRCTIKT